MLQGEETAGASLAGCRRPAPRPTLPTALLCPLAQDLGTCLLLSCLCSLSSWGWEAILEQNMVLAPLPSPSRSVLRSLSWICLADRCCQEWTGNNHGGDRSQNPSEVVRLAPRASHSPLPSVYSEYRN